VEQTHNPDESSSHSGARPDKTTTDSNVAPDQDASQPRDHDANIRAADHRATALASVATLASTLALTGATVVIDTEKWNPSESFRTLFGVLLVIAVILFTLAAGAALAGHSKRGPATLGMSDDKHKKVNLSMGFLLLGMIFVVALTIVSMLNTGSPTPAG
jgi:hypothetical protein